MPRPAQRAVDDGFAIGNLERVQNFIQQNRIVAGGGDFHSRSFAICFAVGQNRIYSCAMRNRFTLSAGVVFLLAIGLPVRQSWGWIATGHKVIAMIAWEDLTPKTRAAVTAILEKHPRFEKDLEAGEDADATPQEKALHVFAQAATWPDMIRLQENPMHEEFHHPAWHYIDIPYAVGDAKAVEKTAPGPGPHNIVEALTQCTAELKDPKTPEDKKAIDLCWVEHLVGDIEQPLHTASLFSEEFPKGDQGGNSEIVLKEPPYPDSNANLHFIWDSLPGDFLSDDPDHYEAEGLHGDPKYSREKLATLLKDKNFMDWAKESHALAVDDAYLNGKLQAAENHGRRGAAGGQIPGLPPGYMQQAEKVAMHQVALGGYRLADLLNSIFDPK
jgi:hypothetical protein